MEFLHTFEKCMTHLQQADAASSYSPESTLALMYWGEIEICIDENGKQDMHVSPEKTFSERFQSRNMLEA